MSPADSQRLLQELQAITSPVERVNLLARAWRSLRLMDGAQRRELAASIGLERAEGLLERLAQSKGRVTPGLLLEAIRRLKRIEPGQIGDLLAGVRDPAVRDELLRRGLRQLESTEPGEAPSEPPGVPEAAEDEEALPPVSSDAAAPGENATGVVAAHVAAAEPSAVEELPAPRPDEESEMPAAEPAPSPVPPTPETSPVPVQVEPHADEPPREPSERVGQETGGETPPGTDLPSARTDTRTLAARLHAAGSLMQRLRTLDREVDDARGSGDDELRDLLEAFPDGWARRRALSTLFRSGVPESLDGALGLIEQLSSPAARRWCAAELLAGRDLGERERETVVQRCRLTRRHRRREPEKAERGV